VCVDHQQVAHALRPAALQANGLQRKRNVNPEGNPCRVEHDADEKRLNVTTLTSAWDPGTRNITRCEREMVYWGLRARLSHTDQSNAIFRPKHLHHDFQVLN
jgi:hypothetical protein